MVCCWQHTRFTGRDLLQTEELKAAFDKKTPQPLRVEPEPAHVTQPKALRKMI